MIKDVINNFIENWAKNQEIYLKIGKVKSVNEEEKTFLFVPNTGDGEIDVAMTVFDGETYIIPKIDTVVLIGYTNNVDAYCLQVKEVKKTVFNGGENEGLINITDLTLKLNSLKDKVNDLYNLLQTWSVAAGDGGLALKTAALLLTGADSFDKSDYEDEKILH